MTLSKPDLQKKCHHLEEQLNHEMQAKDNLELKCRYRTHTHTHMLTETQKPVQRTFMNTHCIQYISTQTQS